ncbi:MAG: sigma-70 family RNA polymerase sigma factor [Gemmatimonas sp.]|nr:sigma-70 family RNA polymerase sigma factor [Gemmatimonas sp.]
MSSDTVARPYVPPSGSMGDSFAPLEDESIARRLRAGDPAALQSVIDAYWAPLLDYVQSILGDPDEGEDIVQEALVRLWTKRGSGPVDTPVAPFLFRVVRNLALNRSRDLGVRMRFALSRLGMPVVRSPTPADDCAASELATAVDAALARLPARRREVFELSRVHGLSYQQIAEVLEISPQTVANQMSRALLDLRGHLSAFLPST